MYCVSDMKITIDCDEEELLLDDEHVNEDFLQIGIHRKDGDSSFTTVSKKELANALKAFI